MSNANINAAKKVKFTEVKKYQKYASLVKIKLDLLYN